MDERVALLLLVLAFLLFLLLLMFLGFRRRQRRQAGLPRPDGVPAEVGARLFESDGLYVATTVADQPLERIAVGGLGFRARAAVVVFERGVVLGLAGEPDAFLPAARIDGVERSTYTIDRVVERGGLAKISWRLGEQRVDSFLRLPDAATQSALIGAIESILTHPAPIGRTGEEG